MSISSAAEKSTRF